MQQNKLKTHKFLVMNRRNALKNMGKAMGYAVATPTILSILQSCKQEVSITWVPEFFSLDEAKMVEGFADLIIPKTDIPGAKELNVAKFIDMYANEVISIDEGKEIKSKAATTLIELGGADVSTDKYDALLAKYLKATDSEKDAFNEEEKSVSEFVNQVKGMTVWGFKTSEEIGENVMAYDPIPGAYIGCESLEELTGGKAWSSL